MGAPGGRTQAKLGSEKTEVTGSEPRLKEKRKQGREQVGTDSSCCTDPSDSSFFMTMPLALQQF